MRIAVAVALLAACSSEGSRPFDPSAQGPCTDLDDDACRADDRCQLAYVDSGFQPSPSPLLCLAIANALTEDTPCNAKDEHACRARSTCSPVYWQELGPNDGPVGDPTFDHCTAEADLADLEPAQGACSNRSETECRAAASCQPLYIVAGGSPGPRFANCLAIAVPATPTASCPPDRADCRARPDCAMVFEQAKGPTDGDVGDPFFTSCELESAFPTQ